MKNILFSVVSMVTLLLIFSCNRFDNTFKTEPEPEPEKTIEEFFTEFSDSLREINYFNKQSILHYYDNDYLNNGLDTLYIINFYDSILALGDSIDIQTQLIDFCNESLKIKWEMIVIDSFIKEVLFDTVLIDYLKKVDKSYKYYGNQSIIPFTEFIFNFQQTISNGLINNNLSKIMDYYCDDYLNNGLDKTGMQIIFQIYASLITTNLEILSFNVDEYNLKFTYWIIDDSSGLNTSFVEYAKIHPDSFLLVGNEKTSSDISKSKVLVELFTATWCPNCPYCEDALHTLMDEYGDKFYYFEYHMIDDLDIGNSEIFNYYQIGGLLPTSIFQGQSKIIGGGTDSYQEYRNALLTFFETDASAILDNFNYEIVNDTLNGTIQIDLIGDISLDDLYLKYAFVEEVSSVNNFAGDPCRQVVIAKGEDFVGDVDFSNLIEFSLELPDNIPDDLILYVWLQTLTDPYDSDICKIYNVIYEEIILPK